MHKIPVIIRSKNRLPYLIYTLNSLLALPYSNQLNILIIDDCSQNQKMQQFLQTNNKIQLNFQYLKHYNFAQQQILEIKSYVDLPNIDYVYGIKDKYDIHINEHSYGDRAGALQMIKYGFEKFDSNYIICLQQDCLFHEDWLSSLLDIYQKEKHNCGLISNCKLIPGNNDLLLNKGIYSQLLYPNSTSFQSILVTKQAYNCLKQQGQFQKQFEPYENIQNKSLLTSQSNFNISGDAYICKALQKNNIKIFQTNESFIQHIGILSNCRSYRIKLLFSKFFNKKYVYDKII